MTPKSVICNRILKMHVHKEIPYEVITFLRDSIPQEILSRPIYVSRLELAVVAKNVGFKDIRILTNDLPPIENVIVGFLKKDDLTAYLNTFKESFLRVLENVLKREEIENVRRLLKVTDRERDHVILATVLVRCPHCRKLVIPSANVFYRFRVMSKEFFKLTPKIENDILTVTVEKIATTPEKRPLIGRIECPECGSIITNAERYVEQEYVPLVELLEGGSRYFVEEKSSWSWNLDDIKGIITLSKEISEKYLDPVLRKTLHEYLDPIGLILWSLLIEELRSSDLFDSQLNRYLTALILLEYLEFSSKHSILSPIGFVRGFMSSLMRGSPIGRPWVSLVPGTNVENNAIYKAFMRVYDCLITELTDAIKDGRIKFATNKNADGSMFIYIEPPSYEIIEDKVNSILSAISTDLKLKTTSLEGLIERIPKTGANAFLVLLRGRLRDVPLTMLNNLITRFNFKKTIVSPLHFLGSPYLMVFAKGDFELKYPEKMFVEDSYGEAELERLLDLVERLTGEPAREYVKKSLLFRDSYTLILISKPTIESILRAMSFVKEPSKSLLLYLYNIKDLKIPLAVIIKPAPEKVHYLTIQLEDTELLESISKKITEEGKGYGDIYLLESSESVQEILRVLYENFRKNAETIEGLFSLRGFHSPIRSYQRSYVPKGGGSMNFELLKEKLRELKSEYQKEWEKIGEEILERFETVRNLVEGFEEIDFETAKKIHNILYEAYLIANPPIIWIWPSPGGFGKRDESDTEVVKEDVENIRNLILNNRESRSLLLKLKELNLSEIDSIAPLMKGVLRNTSGIKIKTYSSWMCVFNPKLFMYVGGSIAKFIKDFKLGKLVVSRDYSKMYKDITLVSKIVDEYIELMKTLRNIADDLGIETMAELAFYMSKYK